MLKNPDIDTIKKLITSGENLTVEFKKCGGGLNRDVYETVCAFLNRHGGTLLLGVSDNREVTGISEDTVEQIRKDFVTAINNPQKINPPCYLQIEEMQIDNKTILKIFVPESSQVHRCNGRIYDRNEDGDFDITDYTNQVAGLYQRKQATYSENKVYTYYQPEHLRHDLIEKCRRIARINTQDHPWAEMDDLQLLQSAQLYQIDPLTQKPGVTLAGVMIFGTDDMILHVCPAHRTDLILRKVDVDRYDDRDMVRTNLIDSYDRIIAFIQKHLPDPFYLEGIERISLRDIIFREVASNILIHREYASGIPARMIIEYGKVTTENANRPHGFGPLNLKTYAPFPKNPVIGSFFREIHRADELGSGMRKMMKYGKAYGSKNPELIEGDVFRIVISVPEFSGKTISNSKAPVEAPVDFSETERRILDALSTEPLGRSALLESLGYKQRTGNFKKAIERLLQVGYIEYTIPDKPNSRLQKYRLVKKSKNG